MHSRVSNHNESTREDGKPNDIVPQAAVVESESAEDGGAWNFNVEAIFVVDQGEVFDFVDDEAFEPVVEDRELWLVSMSIDYVKNGKRLLFAATTPPSGWHRD